MTALAMLITACSSYPQGKPVSSTASVPGAAASRQASNAGAARPAPAYYASENSRKASGKGRNGSLPPGIAKQLERGKPLPPGLAKEYPPAEILVSLPSPGRGLQYVVVAGKLVLIEVATQVVRDVLTDVLFD